MTYLEKAKEMIGERKHYRTLRDALNDAAYAASKWSYKQTDSVFTRDELSRLGVVMDLEKPLESSTYYILTIEGAIGVSTGYEYEAKWLFLPVAPAEEPKEDKMPVEKLENEPTKKETVVEEIAQKPENELEEAKEPIEEPSVALEQVALREESEKAVHVEPMAEVDTAGEFAQDSLHGADEEIKEKPLDSTEIPQNEIASENLALEETFAVDVVEEAEDNPSIEIEEVPSEEEVEEIPLEEVEEIADPVEETEEETLEHEETEEAVEDVQEKLKAEILETNVSKDAQSLEEDHELDPLTIELLDAAEKMAKEREEAVCNVCGQKIQPGMEYCIYCGAPVQDNDEDSLDDSVKNNIDALMDSLENHLLEQRHEEQETMKQDSKEEEPVINLILPEPEDLQAEQEPTEEQAKKPAHLDSEEAVELQDIGPVPFFRDPVDEPVKVPFEASEIFAPSKKEEETGRVTLSLGVMCSRCGKLLKPEDRFCTDCGTPVAEVDPPVQEKVVARKKTEQETLPCPNCGKPVKITNKFCMFCGSPVGKKKESSSIHCIKCGAVLKDGYKFCIKCGTRQE